jgi:hypothetical protein
MKTLKPTLIALFSLAVILVACEKTTPEFTPAPSTNAPSSMIKGFFKDNLSNATQTFNVDPSSSQTITGDKGTRITFGPNTFTYGNGTPVSGNIDIEMIEAQHKKEMLLLNRQTVTNDGELLVSGGIVYVNATQNGQQLSINDNNPIQASIPTNTFDQMDYFVGTEFPNGTFGWDQDTADTVVTNTDSTGWNGNTGGIFSYDFTIDSIGWINCDYFYNSPDPLTGVEVHLPDSFNGSNSSVFIYYSSINSVASIYDWDNDGVFELGGSYSTPVGMNIDFVVISELNGNFYYALVNATIVNNHVEIISSSDMTGPFTSAQIQTMINNL